MKLIIAITFAILNAGHLGAVLGADSNKNTTCWFTVQHNSKTVENTVTSAMVAEEGLETVGDLKTRVVAICGTPYSNSTDSKNITIFCDPTAQNVVLELKNLGRKNTTNTYLVNIPAGDGPFAAATVTNVTQAKSLSGDNSTCTVSLENAGRLFISIFGLFSLLAMF